MPILFKKVPPMSILDWIAFIGVLCNWVWLAIIVWCWDDIKLQAKPVSFDEPNRICPMCQEIVTNENGIG